jgi:glutamate formiminotransferase/formiminotetrahydrofolate cyclodeaminase
VPLYQQLREILREEIVSGRLKADERVATELELMRRFGVSRTTVRQTIAALRKEGLLSVHRGKGTFVGAGAAARLRATSVDGFLAALASSTPLPGGGAAAALGGALGAGLVAMVGRVTGERDGAARDEMAPITTTADRLKDQLASLMGEDVEAYRGLLRARKRAAGPAAIEAAMERATEVPLGVARASCEVLGLCANAAPRARASTLSDLGVAAALAGGALEAAALTVRTNLKDLQNAARARAVAEELGGLIASGSESRRRAAEVIGHRIEGL